MLGAEQLSIRNTKETKQEFLASLEALFEESFRPCYEIVNEVRDKVRDVHALICGKGSSSHVCEGNNDINFENEQKPENKQSDVNEKDFFNGDLVKNVEIFEPANVNGNQQDSNGGNLTRFDECHFVKSRSVYTRESVTVQFGGNKATQQMVNFGWKHFKINRMFPNFKYRKKQQSSSFLWIFWFGPSILWCNNF